MQWAGPHTGVGARRGVSRVPSSEDAQGSGLSGVLAAQVWVRESGEGRSPRAPRGHPDCRATEGLLWFCCEASLAGRKGQERWPGQAAKGFERALIPKNELRAAPALTEVWQGPLRGLPELRLGEGVA